MGCLIEYLSLQYLDHGIYLLHALQAITSLKLNILKFLSYIFLKALLRKSCKVWSEFKNNYNT